jgi:presenilin-like A22 family membrane protease
VDQVRTTAALISPLASVELPSRPTVNHNVSVVSRGLVLGAVLSLLLIAASLLVGQLEQLRERRRVLAVLCAVGTARRVIALSVLWQSVLPMLLGLVPAVADGLALGAVPLHLVDLPTAFDRGAVGLMVGLGALSVLVVTLGSQPLLMRMMRPGGLRHERPGIPSWYEQAAEESA